MENNDLVILAQTLEKIGYLIHDMETVAKGEVNFTIMKKEKA